MLKGNKTHPIHLFVLAFWLCSMGGALWWFTLGKLDQFSNNESLVMFEGSVLQQSVVELRTRVQVFGKDSVTLVHFRDGGCPCTASNDIHFQKIVKAYKEKGVNFLIVERNNANTFDQAYLSVNDHSVSLDSIPLTSSIHQLPSSPAVAVLSKNGALAYFGPYSLGAMCNSSNKFVENTLDVVLKGGVSYNLNTIGLGCFCAWEKARAA